MHRHRPEVSPATHIHVHCWTVPGLLQQAQAGGVAAVEPIPPARMCVVEQQESMHEGESCGWKVPRHHDHYLEPDGGIADRSQSLKISFLECYRMQLLIQRLEGDNAVHVCPVTLN